MAALGLGLERRVGLLILRADRGDRTLQWVAALQEGFLEQFGRLYVVGLHARAVQRRLQRFNVRTPVQAIATCTPAETTHIVLSGIRENGGVVFGFGNIAGPGEALIAHWNAIGEPFEV